MADLDVIRKLNAIAWDAGRITLDYFRSDVIVDAKADASPVTEADRAAEGFILAELERHFPGVPVVAEEAVSMGKVPASAPLFFLVDPLDGTREFIAGRPDYTVNIALMESRRPIAGVVHAPARTEAFAGSLAAGAFRIGEEGSSFGEANRIAVRKVPASGIVAVASRSHNSPETDAFLDRFTIADRVSVGSSLKFCLLASGQADLYPRYGRTMEWDTAAGHAVLLAAGGEVISTSGDPLAYDKRDQDKDADFANPHFVCFGDPALKDEVRAACAALVEAAA